MGKMCVSLCRIMFGSAEQGWDIPDNFDCHRSISVSAISNCTCTCIEDIVHKSPQGGDTAHVM